MKKKVFCIAVVFTMIVGSAGMCFGVTDEQLKHAPDTYSPERIAEIEELKDKIEQENANVPMSGERKLLSISATKQENNYYCGPACVYMTLRSFRIIKTQQQLAQQMGTTLANGTYVYKARDCLNSYLGGGISYKYVYTSEIPFNSGLQYSIKKGMPVLCHTRTGKLPGYRERGKDLYHYVLATGYEWGMQGGSGSSKVYYKDPINDNELFGARICTWSEMTEAINRNAGLYIMAS